MDRDKVDRLERMVALSRALSEDWRGYGAGHWGRGPMFGGTRRRRGDVRHAILWLLTTGAYNGYGLMQTIEERSGGRWRPSPGSVYPTLAQLEDEGLVRATEHEGTKLYELTAAGRKRAREGGEPAWEGDGAARGEDCPDLRVLVHGLRLAAAQVGQAGTPDQVRQVAELLARTRREIYRILAEDGESDG